MTQGPDDRSAQPVRADSLIHSLREYISCKTSGLSFLQMAIRMLLTFCQPHRRFQWPPSQERQPSSAAETAVSAWRSPSVLLPKALTSLSLAVGRHSSTRQLD